MKKIFLFLFVVLLPLPSMSNTVTVSTGEHSNFTRTAFSYDAKEDAKLDVDVDVSGRTINVRSEYEFDLNNVFRRISRNRISDISLNDGELKISYNCDCTAEVQILEKYAFVDIITDDEASLNAVNEGTKSSKPINPPRITNPVKVYSSISNSFFEKNSSVEVSREGLFKDPEQEIKRFATSGLLNPSDMPKSGGSLNFDSHSDVIETRSAIYSGDVCLDSRIFDFPGGRDDFGDSVPSFANLSDLVDERGRIDESKAIGQIRKLLALGVGVETKPLLALIEGDSKGIYSWMSDVIENNEPDIVFPLEVLCDPGSQYWDFIGSNYKRYSTTNFEQMYQYFMSLPQGIQKVTANRFVKQLELGGGQDIAKLVLYEMGSAAEQRDYELSAALATISDDGNSTAKISKILNEKPNAGPDALNDLIDSALDEGRPISQKYINLASAYVDEYDKTSIGSDVWLSLVSGKLAHKDFDGAYRTILEENQWVEREDMDSAIDRFTEAVLQNAGDSIFLKYFWGQEVWFYESMSGKLKLEAAERLLNLGFYSEVEKYIGSGGLDIESTKFRIIQARSFLKQKKARETELALADMDDPEAVKLRAEARKMLGDLQYASTLYAAIDDRENSALLDWMAGNMESPSVVSNEKLGRYAGALTNSEMADHKEEYGNKDLLRRVQNDRAVLEDLVNLEWQQ